MAAIIPKITKLSPRVLRILGCNPGPMTLQGTNTYLLGTGPKRILVDTGDGKQPEYINALHKVLEENSLSLQSIILTHWHHDHTGGVKPVLETISKCPVYKFPCPERAEELEIDGVELRNLSDEETVSTEGATLRVKYTPGHTSDHIILVLEEENAILCGDCMLGEGTAVFEDLYDYMRSLERMLQAKPSLIYPAHGPVIEDPVKRIQYYINHRLEREKQILEFLVEQRHPLSPLDIVKGVYKDLDPRLYSAAEHNVIHHLTKLLKENKVSNTNGSWSSKQASSKI